jgi:lysophospholipase L1-like esterase
VLGLAASARTLLETAPRAAADQLALAALLLLPACELGSRASYLDTAWDAARLTGDAVWRRPEPFWEATCGGAGDAPGVVFVGGSSTGGAYQLRGEPDAFFPARTHARLCAGAFETVEAAAEPRSGGTPDRGGVAEGSPTAPRAPVSVHTTNFGDSGRDTHTISRSIAHLLARGEPRVLVLYVGVNDVLTSHQSLTRKQIEAETAARRGGLGGIVGLSERSRVLTGLGLLRRPPPGVGGPGVPAVPLADAEENVRRVVAAADARGARVVLVPEFVRSDMRRQLAGHADLLRRLAGELEDVTFVDLAEALAPYAEEDLLVDGNHLSREGGERVAEVLAPVVAGLLGATETRPAPLGGAP